MWITFNRFSTLFEVFVPPFYLPCTHCIFPESFLNPPNSFRGGMFKLNTKFDVDSLLYLLILNVMATQYTCSLNSIYRPHWLVQWSCHCSCMHIPVHSPWLPGCTNALQTILIILTTAGRFPDITVFWSILKVQVLKYGPFVGPSFLLQGRCLELSPSARRRPDFGPHNFFLREAAHFVGYLLHLASTY